ncbi:MAG: hypothetical protein M3Q06_11260 [Bacteroidota bacterium]|nr:hypothetical protein [Bacteroidota bacterium]
MKKLFVLAALFTALFITTTASAQGGPGGDPQQMRQRMIERVKPQLVEKTKLTDAEAEKVLDIYMATQPQRREIRMDQSMSDEDKAKKMAAIEEEAGKKFKAIPLSDEKVKAVNEFFEEMRKNMQNRRNGGN